MDLLSGLQWHEVKTKAESCGGKLRGQLGHGMINCTREGCSCKRRVPCRKQHGYLLVSCFTADRTSWLRISIESFSLLSNGAGMKDGESQSSLTPYLLSAYAVFR